MQEEFIYGRNSVEAALSDGERSINKIYLLSSAKSDNKLNKILKIAKENKIPFSFVPKEKFTKMLSDEVNHQGVVASVSPVEFADIYDVIDIIKNSEKLPLIVILDGVEDPQNVGSAIRSSEVLGANAVIIPKHRASGVTGTVAKASSGAIEFIPVARVTNIVDSIEKLKSAGLWIVGAEYAPESQMLYDIKYDMPCGIVVGSEGKGLSRLVKKSCDFIIKIPQYGKTNSLNVANALSILLYEVVRQRAGV